MYNPISFLYFATTAALTLKITIVSSGKTNTHSLPTDSRNSIPEVVKTKENFLLVSLAEILNLL